MIWKWQNNKKFKKDVLKYLIIEDDSDEAIQDKMREFSKLTSAQRLQWIAKTHRFLKKFMPDESKIILQKFRTGES